MVRYHVECSQITHEPLFAEVVGFVERVEHLYQTVDGSRQATNDQIDFSTRGWFAYVIEGKTRTPEEVFDNSPLELRRIGGNLHFERLDHLIRIVEWLANGDFGAVHEIVEAIGGLLPVVGANHPSLTVIKGCAYKIQVAIEHIDALSLDG